MCTKLFFFFFFFKSQLFLAGKCLKALRHLSQSARERRFDLWVLMILRCWKQSRQGTLSFLFDIFTWCDIWCVAFVICSPISDNAMSGVLEFGSEMWVYYLFYDFLGLINRVSRIDNDARPKCVSVRDPSFSYLTKCVGGSLSRRKKQRQLKRWPSILRLNFTFLLCVDSLRLATDHLLVWSLPLF